MTMTTNQVGLRLALAGTPPEVDTCVTDRHQRLSVMTKLTRMVVTRAMMMMMLTTRQDNTGHEEIKDGPFPWDASIEGFLNSIIRC